MKPLLSLRAVLEDETLLGHPRIMGGESREPMRALLLASQGEALSDSELGHYRRLTGRDVPPNERVAEAHFIAGRRSGKSSGAAALAVYMSAFVDFSDVLQPGEVGIVLLVAENQKQARVLLNYVAGIFEACASLAALVVNRTQTSLSLSNGIDIEVRSADFRGLRGLTLICAIGDEISFWMADGASPDREIIAAIRPALATTRGQLMTIGSPYAKRGFQYDTFVRHYGPTGDRRVLVAKGATKSFNSTIPDSTIEREVAEDPAAAQSEWFGEFRDDIEGFIARERLEACVIDGRYELPPQPGISYSAFADPSGGGGGDSMTLCVAHKTGDVVIIDAIREVKPPFSPDLATKDFCETLRVYGVATVIGDAYADQWPAERFAHHGIRYLKADRPKSALYRDVLPKLTSGRVELLDDDRLVTQFAELERRRGRSGKDIIDHAQKVGAHDDVANCVAGAIVVTAEGDGALAGLSAYLGSDGQGVPIPSPAFVYASLYVAKSGPRLGRAAVVFFATQRGFGNDELVLCDFADGMLSDALLHDVIVRLGELADATHSQYFALFADEGTLGRFAVVANRHGDRRACWDEARELGPLDPANAAASVANGRVRISQEALVKAQSSPIGAALAFQFGDTSEMSLAIVQAIVAAFEIQ